MPASIDTLIGAGSSRVLRRPHYRLQGHELFFMASTRPHCRLSAPEFAIWLAIANAISVDALRERFPADADEVIRSFWRRELCELVERDFAPARRRVLVIEPHPDDAALSIAGTMWLRRHDCEFIVATLAGRSNYTSYYNLERDYFDVERVAALRREESQMFTRMLGGRHVDIGRTDAALRYRDTAPWSLDYFRRNRMVIAAATARTADARERARWVQEVQKLLADTPSDEVWIPLGAPHADHVLTTNACLAAFVSAPSLVAGRLIKVYQDVPYAARTPYFSGEMLATLARAGVELDPETIAIDAAFESKLRLVSVYASQFKIAAMREDIEASALAKGSAAVRSEQFWTVRALPKRIDADGIFPASADKEAQEQSSEAWLAKHRQTRRVRVLLLLPTGRWASDLECLREAMPDASFEVFAAPAAAVEVADAPSDRVELRRVAAGTWAWALLALQLAVARPMPTLFLAGDERHGAARALSRLWPLSDTLAVASMNRVMRAIESRPRVVDARSATA